MMQNKAEKTIKVSVVIPCYYSEQTIAKVVSLTRDELIRLKYDYEFVLVNDGSTDGTFDEIRRLHADDPRVVGINFTRNFGQHNAIIAGLQYVTGDYVMLMDDDMQTHPSQCETLLNAMKGGWDVVFGKYKTQHEAWWKRLGSRFTLWSMRILTKRPKDIVASNFFVMKKFIADKMIQYDGPYTYIQGLLFRITDKMCNVEIQHFEREIGSSGYTFKSSLKLWSTVLNFSIIPLRMASLIGGFMGLLGIIWAVFLAVQRILNPTIQAGWSSLIVTILICAGMTILFLGLIGEYLGRLFMTINKAPQFVLREVIGVKKESVND